MIIAVDWDVKPQNKHIFSQAKHLSQFDGTFEHQKYMLELFQIRNYMYLQFYHRAW